MATVDTDWVLLTVEGRPARVPRVIAEYFAQAPPFTRDRIVLPEPEAAVTRLEAHVRPLDVDPMRHMNNAAYADMVDHGIARMADGARIVRPDCYRIGYVRPALPGTRVDIACWRVGRGQAACRISDDDGLELTKALVSRETG